MKNTLFQIFIATFFSFSSAYAHKEWIHQFIAQEAYQFLENYYVNNGCSLDALTKIKNAIFDERTGKLFKGSIDDRTNDPWLTNFGIAIGEWREDTDDPIWGYNLLNGGTASVTHFWNADYGDNTENDIGLGDPKPNALTKAKYYLFGGTTLNINMADYDFKSKRLINGYRISYNSLVEFYRTGKCKLWGRYFETTYEPYENGPIEVTNYTYSKIWSMQILGRVAHLLQDMGVPAHAHNHEHPCPLCEPDYYEMEMGGSWDVVGDGTNCENMDGILNTPYAYNYTASTAASQGGLIEEALSLDDVSLIRYLFYSSNQLADFFPSGVNNGTGEGSLPVLCVRLKSKQIIKAGDNSLNNGSNDYVTSRYQT